MAGYSDAFVFFTGAIGGQIGTIDGAIGASISASNSDTGGAIVGTVTAIGNAATMFPGVPSEIGALSVAIVNIGKTGGDLSQITIGDILTIGAAVATLVNAPIVGLGLTVGGIGFTLFKLKNPGFDPTIADLLPWNGIDIKFGDVSLGPDLSIPRNQRISPPFQGARSFIQRYDPLALDLDGDGLETVGITATTQILFDHDGDGIKTGTGWVKGDDAFLALDRNGNGTIDNGSELFGVDTVLTNGQKAANGFAALADLDSNHDGKFSSADAQFGNVRVWRDLNQDGISQADELQTLAAAGIASINLTSTASSTNLGNGNVLSAAGTFTKTDGQTGTAGDFSTGSTGNLDLASNPFYSQFTDSIPLTAGAAALPDMQGAGYVRNLREAASINSILISDIGALSGTSRSQMMGQLDSLIQHWADSSSFKTSQERAAEMGMTLCFWIPGVSSAELQALQLVGLPGIDKSMLLMTLQVSEERYDAVKAQMDQFGKMMGVLEKFNGQTFLSFPATGGIQMATGAQIETRTKDIVPMAGSASVSFSFALPTLNATHIQLLQQSYDALKQSVYEGLVLQTRLKGYLDAVNLVIDQNGISTDFSALETRLKNLNTTDEVAAVIDRIELVRFAGETLNQLGWKGQQELVNEITQLERDGKWDAVQAQLRAQLPLFSVSGDGVLFGTLSSDTLSGGAQADLIDGGSGNDTLRGDDGNDTLLGGTGDDRLYGGNGNDVLVGGIGNDTLYGGTHEGWGGGNDTYQFRKGDGQDIINDFDSTIGNIDTIQFMDASSSEVSFVKSGSDLLVNYGSGDQVRVTNYFHSFVDYAVAYRIEQLKFADGVVWGDAEIKARTITNGTEGNDDISGYIDGSNQMFGLDGNDTLSGGAQADLIDGGSGNDTLRGDDGNDTLLGGTGDDRLYGGNGNDVLVGGIGNDTLYGGTHEGWGGGNDTYQFRKGDGQDIINDYDTTAGNIDTIQFMDVSSSEVSFVKSGSDLLVNYGSGDQIRVTNYFHSSASYAVAYRIEQLKFSDGVVWGDTEIKARTITNGTAGNDDISGYIDGSNQMFGLDGNDTLSGGAQADLIDGGSGNDTLRGDDGNDTLLGGTGDDRLYGGNGNDVLVGGIGNDTLYGGTHEGWGGGNDTYQFRKGDGQDIINDFDSTIGNIDTIQFMDASSSEVSFVKSGSDLLVNYGSGDQVRVTNYFHSFVDYAVAYRIEQLKFADGVVWGDAEIKARTITNGTEGNDDISGYIDGSNQMFGLDGNDTLSGGAQADLIDGGSGNDTLRGDDGNDTLLGGTGDDRLYGGNGNDVLVGGIGNDTLYGGTHEGWGGGNDTYQFRKGDGQDIINDYDTTAGNIDTIQFMDVSSSEVSFVKSGSDLLVNYGSGDQIRVTNYFHSSASYAVAYRIEQLKFSDGVVWGDTEIKARTITNGTAGNDDISGYIDGSNQMFGLDGNDTLSGGAQADLIDGGSGNDTLRGDDGNDTLLGGTGDDRLYGGNGNDVLVGGIGNDTLYGGTHEGWGGGNDTYQFRKGDGQDIINDYDTTAGNIDTIQFMDVSSSEVSFVKSGSDLLVNYGSGDQVRVTNYFHSSASYAVAYRIEQLKFSDGVVWGDTEIKARTITNGTAGNDDISGYIDGSNQMFGLDGNDTLSGGAQADLIDGGSGNDTLRGDDGNDTLLGGTGDDRLYGGNGNDVLVGGIGNDTLYGGTHEGWGGGNDTYQFRKGDGQDIINDFDSTIGNIDTIQFMDASSSEVSFVKSGSDLLVNYGSGDQVRVTNYFHSFVDYAVAYRIEQLKFADGVVWGDAEIKARTLTYGTANNDSITGYTDGSNTIYGLDGHDYLYGGALADLIDGGSGNDKFYGQAGNDLLRGAAGDDTLNGDGGDDLLIGGTGNDTLYGGDITSGKGNDTYQFSKGDGQDIINDFDSTAGNIDTIQFMDVSSSEVSFVKSGSDLLVNYGSGDQVRVTNYFHSFVDYAVAYRIEQLKFADGVVWGDAEIKARTLTYGTANNDSITGYTDGSNTIYGLDGHDYLYGGALADLIDGGNGDDSLVGGEGNDLLEGGDGNDVLSDTAGVSLFNGGSGTDTITGGAGAELFLGGLGNDTYSTAGGNDIILFNKGDGQDTFASGGTGSDTLSLGGGVGYTDLSFSKSSNDLVLNIGASDQITFKNWYAATPSKPVANLQVIAEAMADFAQGGSDPLKDQKVEKFNFAGLVGAFDAARTADSGLTSWALTNALTAFQLGGSDTAALGGDLAYQYGKNGTLAGIGVTPALATISDANLGTVAQTLSPLAGLQTGSVRLS